MKSGSPILSMAFWLSRGVICVSALQEEEEEEAMDSAGWDHLTAKWKLSTMGRHSLGSQHGPTTGTLFGIASESFLLLLSAQARARQMGRDFAQRAGWCLLDWLRAQSVSRSSPIGRCR